MNIDSPRRSASSSGSPDSHRTAVRKARVLAIASGKGGVGKTNVTANLGIALASRGHRVCVFDADSGLANIHIMLGLQPTHTLEHVLSGECTVSQIAIDGPAGIKIIPAATGVADCIHLTPERRSRLVDAFRELETQFDYVLLDTAAGAGETVVQFVQASPVTLIVVTPEPTSLSNGFALLRVLRRCGYARPVHAVVNMVLDFEESRIVFERFAGTVQKYLRLKVGYAGYVTVDDMVPVAVRLQRPVIVLKHGAPASRCFYALAEVIDEQFDKLASPHSFSGYWARLAGSGSAPVARSGGARDVAAARTEGGSKHDCVHTLTQWLRSEDVQQNQAQCVVAELVQRYVARFERYPFDTRRALYESLQMQGFPTTEIREVAVALERLYEKRAGASLHGLEERILNVVADSEGSEQRMRELADLLESGFRKRFGKELYDAGSQLLAQVEARRVGGAELARLLRRLHDLYRTRIAPRDTGSSARQ